MNDKNSDLLVWMDMEMTGLDPEKERIIEMATLITDKELNLVAEGPVIAVHQPDDILAAMDEWNQTHHGASGLVDRVKASVIDEKTAEQQTLAFIQKHVSKRSSPLCGNTIWQDRRFIIKYMPKLDKYLHYRCIDVSTIKELAGRWYPDLKRFDKQKNHTALDDIRESIEELKYYRAKVFVS